MQYSFYFMKFNAPNNGLNLQSPLTSWDTYDFQKFAELNRWSGCSANIALVPGSARRFYQNAGVNGATTPARPHHSYIPLNPQRHSAHKVPYWHPRPQSHDSRVHRY